MFRGLGFEGLKFGFRISAWVQGSDQRRNGEILNLRTAEDLHDGLGLRVWRLGLSGPGSTALNRTHFVWQHSNTAIQ